MSKNVPLLTPAPLLWSLVLSIVCLTACGKNHSAAKKPGADHPVAVTTTIVQPRAFSDALQALGTAQARESVTITAKVSDVVTRLTNGYVGPTRNIYHESGVPYLLARHVKNNRLLFDGRTFITDEFNRKNKKSMLKADDVLLVQSGHIGHSAVVTKAHEGHNCHAMIVITPVKGAFIGSFLSLFFNSSGMKQKFQEIRSGSTVPHLTCGEVKELTVALPDLTTQHRIVDHSRELEAETQYLESLYQRKLAALDALKKSLLHQAFRGQL